MSDETNATGEDRPIDPTVTSDPQAPDAQVQGGGPAPAAEDEGGEEFASQASRAEQATTVEAILFSSDEPMTAAKIAKVAELPGQRAVKSAIQALNARYEQAGSAFRIEAIAGGYQMMTLPQYHDVLARLVQVRQESRLSQAAMETLAIVAYRQPVIRADIEAIRGVACGEVLRGLLEKQLLKIVGRAEVIGRPMLYGTTRRFLELFGISGLEDLPRVEELRSGAKDLDGAQPAENQPPAPREAPASPDGDSAPASATTPAQEPPNE